MFERRALSGELASVREAHAPSARVYDTRRDFETLSPAVAETLLAVVPETRTRSPTRTARE